MNPNTDKAVHVFISGRVQGVWFRGWLAKKATQFEARGWVRNRTDGRVEAVFVGRDEIVKKMLELCHQGPPAARVDDVEFHEVDVPDVMTGFERRSTA